MTTTFETLQIGDIVFVPWVAQKEIEVTCPDCLGGGTWTITTASGVSRTVGCPRCKGGDQAYTWLKPKRYERTLEIKERVIREISVTSRKEYKGEEIYTGISYQTDGGGTVYHRDAHVTREAAEAAGVVMLAEAAAKEEHEYEKELKRHAERSTQDIIGALQSIANAKTKKLEERIETLKQKMMDGVRYPSIDGPKVTRRSYGADEITPANLLEWCQKLLSEADIEGWSEEEIHEATCHC